MVQNLSERIFFQVKVKFVNPESSFNFMLHQTKIHFFDSSGILLIDSSGILLIDSTQSAESRKFFLLFFRTQYSRPLELGSTPSRLFSLRLMFERSKLESLCDVSVTRIGDTLS